MSMLMSCNAFGEQNKGACLQFSTPVAWERGEKEFGAV